MPRAKRTTVVTPRAAEATPPTPRLRGSLAELAQTAEAVAATTKKLEKAALLGAYFQELTDADLARAARYFAGQQFAMRDSRTTNVGTSVLRQALSEATGLAVENL